MQDAGETAADENGLPALSIKVTDVNRLEHLASVVRFELLLSVARKLTAE